MKTIKIKVVFEIKIAIFPGRFDPITLKHLNILKRALKLFDKIIVLVLNNQKSKSTISIQNRLELIKLATNGLNVETDFWEKSIVAYAEMAGACAIVKSVRNPHEFYEEFENFIENKILNSNIETVFFPVSPKYGHIKSSLVFKLAVHGKNLDSMVPSTISTKLTKILSEV